MADAVFGQRPQQCRCKIESHVLQGSMHVTASGREGRLSLIAKNYGVLSASRMARIRFACVFVAANMLVAFANVPVKGGWMVGQSVMAHDATVLS